MELDEQPHTDKSNLGGKKMTFTFRVYYEDDSLLNYGKKQFEMVRARDKYHALVRFKEKYGINPLYAV